MWLNFIMNVQIMSNVCGTDDFNREGILKDVPQLTKEARFIYMSSIP